METILKRNLGAFFERFPKLKDRFQEALLNLEKTPSHYKRVSVNSGFQSFEGSQIIDSSEPGFHQPPPQSFSPQTSIVMEGFGDGSLFIQLMNSPCKAHEYFIIEPSLERFLFACQHGDWSPYFSDKSIQWLIGFSADEVSGALQNMFRSYERAMRKEAFLWVQQPIVHALHRSYFEQIESDWNVSRRIITYLGGSKSDSLTGLHYVLENMKWIEQTPGINRLRNAFRDFPAVVAATGPSLNKSLAELRKIQNRCLMISADASLKILLENGIVPHFVCSIERGDPARKFFENLENIPGGTKTNAVVFPFVPSAVLEPFRGPQWVAYRNYKYLEFLESQIPRGVIATSSSVSHMCVRLADWLGCNPITLVGQDLAFDPQTLASHAKGIAYEDWAKSRTPEEVKQTLRTDEGEEMFWVPGNLGRDVPTIPLYFLFAKEFSWEAQSARADIVNCTQGGAKIPNIPWLPLAEASKTWGERKSIFESIESLRKGTPLNARFDSAPIVQFLEKTKQDLLKISSGPDASSIQQALMKDPLFRAFIVEIDAKAFMLNRNEWAQILPSDSSKQKDLQRLSKEWVELSLDILDDVLKFFSEPGKPRLEQEEDKTRSRASAKSTH